MYNRPVSIYWNTQRGKYSSTSHTTEDGKLLFTKRYTLKHKLKGLAKCKVCEYITATPVRPGTICPCCNQTLSHSIRDIGSESKDKLIKRHE